jgi:glycosyltransferase involved in cell wall biosynthesis
MPKLALVMIARNEQRCITRALESVRPYVDDMILLDTGSTDDTVSLARNAGAKIFHFDWCDDFAKARNAALDHSDADWNLILDADEYLVSDGDILKGLKTVKPNFVGAISIESDFGSGAERQQAKNWLIRLLPASVRFTGRVHEQPAHHLPIKNLNIHCGHDGYLPIQRDQKKGRNERLLLAELNQNPDDPYLHYQLGKEKEVDGDFSNALPSYRKSLSLIGSSLESWQRDLVLRSLFCMKKVKDFSNALELAERWQHALERIPDYHFVLGDLYLDMALDIPAQADTLLPLIEAHWLRCLEIGEMPDIDGCVKGRGSTLAAHNLSVFYETIGVPDKAAFYKNLSMQ